MRIAPALVLAPLCLTSPAAAQSTTPDDPARVLVIYNSSWPDENGDGVGDSEEVARYYAGARGVPGAHLFGFSISTTRRYWSGSSAWASFHDELVSPLMSALAQVGPRAVDTILLCYGVPYYLYAPISQNSRRAVDSLLMAPGLLGDRNTCPLPSYWYNNPYLEYSPSVPPDKGRFDHATYHYGTGSELYLVARIDGMDSEAAKDLVDGARYAELHKGVGAGMLGGKAYIDTRYGFYTDPFLSAGYPFGYSSYASADKCMAFGKFFPPLVGLPTQWEGTGKEIGESGAQWQSGAAADRAPEAFLYGGWYNYRQYFDVWEWLPGSIACDLNSNSIQSFHTGNPNAFLSAAFPRGLSAGCGVVGEPYLSGHPRPEVLLYYVTQGFTFAEAAALAEPSLLWMAVHMGDPLYAPYRAGRQPAPDITPPPAPLPRVTSRAGSSATLEILVPRRPADPDLCTVALEYGADPALGTSVPRNKAYRGSHLLALDNLPDVPGFYYRAELEDPAGLRTASPLLALTQRSFQHVDVRAQALPTQVAPGQVVTIRFACSAEPDLFALTSFRVEVESGGTRIDVTAATLVGAGEIALGAQGETVLFSLAGPAVLPPGTYTFHISAATAGGAATHSTSFTVR